MAAVRRRSGGGMAVALVFCMVLACVGIIGTIWFYNQLQLAKDAIRENEGDFDETIAVVFKDAKWELAKDPVSPLGVTIGRETLDQVKDKLLVAMTYEREIDRKLGYNTVDALYEGMRQVPFQVETAPEDRPDQIQLTFGTVAAIFKQCGVEYTRFTSRNDKLEIDLAALADRVDKMDKARVAEKTALEGTINRNEARHTEALKQLNEGKKTLETARDEERTKNLALAAKLSAKETQWQKEAADLRARIVVLEKELDAYKNPPAELKEEEFVPAGKVVLVEPGVTMIAGGANKGMEVDSRYMVYSESPDGRPQKKAIVAVRKVLKYSCEVIVVSEEGEEPVALDDLYVSLQTWNKLQGQALGGREG